MGVLESDGALSARRIQQGSPPDRIAPSFGPLQESKDGMKDLSGLRDILPDGAPKLEGLSDKLFEGLGCDSDTLADTAMYGFGA